MPSAPPSAPSPPRTHTVRPTTTVATPAPSRREDRLAERIGQGLRHGDLSRREAFELRTDLSRIDALEHRYRWTDSRLSGWERADLDPRLDALGRRVFFERRDWERRRR